MDFSQDVCRVIELPRRPRLPQIDLARARLRAASGLIELAGRTLSSAALMPTVQSLLSLSIELDRIECRLSVWDVETPRP